MKVYKNHVLILGSARSGSSWFSELIAQQHRYRMLFEPEHEFNTSKGKLIADQYLTEENSFEAEKYLRKVFSNRVDNDWIAQNSNRKWKRHLWPFIPKKFIIKMVRGSLGGNFMYGTMKMPTITIIRNPYDTLLSQSRVKFPWLYNLEHFKNQEKVTAILKNRYGFTFSNSSYEPLEALAIRWCIENCDAFEIKQIPGVPLQTVKYEMLKKDINLFREVCNHFNLEPLTNLESRYRVPSSKTHPKSKIVNKDAKQPHFLNQEYEVINHYLDIFQIKSYEREFTNRK